MDTYAEELKELYELSINIMRSNIQPWEMAGGSSFCRSQEDIKIFVDSKATCQDILSYIEATYLQLKKDIVPRPNKGAKYPREDTTLKTYDALLKNKLEQFYDSFNQISIMITNHDKEHPGNK